MTSKDVEDVNLLLSTDQVIIALLIAAATSPSRDPRAFHVRLNYLQKAIRSRPNQHEDRSHLFSSSNLSTTEEESAT